MPEVFPESVDVCVPFRISDGPSVTGSRLGGAHPQGILPPIITGKTRYLLTIVLSDSVEFSLFTQFDFGEMFNSAGIVLAPESSLLHLSFHEPSRRSNEPAVVADLSPHPIELRQPLSDTVVDDGERFVYAHHKVGGRPSLDGEDEQVGAALVGYRQLMQLAFPDRQDATVNGNWPFAGGTLHVFSKFPDRGDDYRYLWQY